MSRSFRRQRKASRVRRGARGPSPPPREGPRQARSRVRDRLRKQAAGSQGAREMGSKPGDREQAMGQRMTIRGYAERRGCTHETVRRAIAAGRITTEKDGKLDPEKADREWTANTAPRMRSGRTAPGTFQHARTRREIARAAVSEIEAAKLRGELVEVSEVRRIVFGRARKARDMLLSMAPRLAPVVAGMGGDTKGCLRAIEDEVSRVLAELAQPDRDAW